MGVNFTEYLQQGRISLAKETGFLKVKPIAFFYI